MAEIGESQLEEGAEAPVTTDLATEQPTIFDDEGKFLGGRFDTDDVPVTQDLIDESEKMGPVLTKLATSYREIEKAYSKAKGNKAADIADGFFESDDFQVSPDDFKMTKKTREAMLGKRITEASLDFFDSVQVDVLTKAKAEQDAWEGGWNKRLGGDDETDHIEAMHKWVAARYPQNQIDEFNAALKSPTTRDAIMQDLAGKWAKDTDQTLPTVTTGGETKKPETLSEGDTFIPGGLVPFGTMQEFADASRQARQSGDKVKIAEVQRRFQASKHLHKMADQLGDQQISG